MPFTIRLLAFWAASSSFAAGIMSAKAGIHEEYICAWLGDIWPFRILNCLIAAKGEGGLGLPVRTQMRLVLMIK